MFYNHPSLKLCKLSCDITIREGKRKRGGALALKSIFLLGGKESKRAEVINELLKKSFFGDKKK